MENKLKPTRKLALKKETLRVLTTTQLDRAQGGGTDGCGGWTSSCESCKPDCFDPGNTFASGGGMEDNYLSGGGGDGGGGYDGGGDW